ncbi:MAG: hypothetical protein KBF88_00220 [Polyangiaceae bacterium]|nr:hypothetical protein [Polyangiaceae bacterium]
MSVAFRRPAMFSWLRLLVLTLLLPVGAFAASEPGVAMDSTSDSHFEEAPCCPECPSDTSGDACPVDCPSCHCHHPSGAFVLPEILGRELAASSRTQFAVRIHPSDATVPHEPSFSAPFRPPRLISFHA